MSTSDAVARTPANAPWTCAYCGAPSWIDPSDQTPPLDCCHEGDHGSADDAEDNPRQEPVRKSGPRSGFRSWELYVTCCKCGHPLDDNPRMKDALATNNVASWAKQNLKVLAEAAEDRGLPDWYVNEVRRIHDGIRLMSSPPGIKQE